MADGEGLASQDFKKLLYDFEQRELEHPHEANELFYSQLIALYLLDNDLINARYAWKRCTGIFTPSSQSELQLVWNCARRLWEKDYGNFYKSINQNWSERLKPLMSVLERKHRQRMLELVSLAYTSISLNDLSIIIGLDHRCTTDMVTKLGWLYNNNSKMFSPMSIDIPKSIPTDANENLHNLTKFINYLEN